MKFSALIAAIAVGALATALAKPTSALPAGWLQAGNPKADCESSVVIATGAPSPKVFNIDCKSGDQGFQTLMQQIAGTDYAGKRVRLSAQVRGEKIAGWGGVWMRSDSGQRMGTAFDNMKERPLSGEFGWKQVEVVLDIPSDATTLSFGFLLEGSGRLQATRFQLDVVPNTTPTTGQGSIPILRRQAQNLTPP